MNAVGRYLKKQMTSQGGSSGRIFVRKTVVLYVIGGVTYGEIACLRKVAEAHGIELLICTTKVISYLDFLGCYLSNEDI